MLSSSFIKEPLSFDYVQFATAIALGQLDEKLAFESVLDFKCLNSNKNKGVDKQILALEREQMVNEIKESNKGLLIGFLEYLDTPDMIPVMQTKGNSKNITMHRLSEILHVHSIQQVYAKTMQIINKYSAPLLLSVFMSLDYYKNIFDSDMRKKYGVSADGVRVNELSPLILDELRNDFISWVDINSSNAYNPETGTPVAFLRNAYNAFYSRSGRQFEIMARQDLMAPIGGEDSDMTTADYAAIEMERDDQETFNFMDVARRINKASWLLFQHNGSKIAFYDIFSCYRDRLSEDKFKEIKISLRKKLNGCFIDVVDSFQLVGSGFVDTVKNKKSGRVALCSVFTPIIENGISQKEIRKYYNDAIELTDTLDEHDGRRLFWTPSHHTKHSESNSEMLQIIITGHLAVRELIAYIESGKSNITVANFPAVIFRDAEYLKRFRDIEEYINYIGPVAELVEDSNRDYNRRLPEVDGFFRNENIFDFLGVNNLLQTAVFRKLSDMPLAIIKNSVEDSRVITKDEKFLHSIKSVFNNGQQLFGYINSYSSGETYPQIFAESLRLSEMIVSSFDTANDPDKLIMMIAFYQSLEKVVKMEGHPFLSDDFLYLYQADDSQQEMVLSIQGLLAKNTADEETVKKYLMIGVKRSVAITKIYNYLTDSEMTKCNWEQLREVLFALYSLCQLHNCMMKRLIDLQQDIKTPNSTFLILANVIEDSKIFDITRLCPRLNEIAFIYRNKVPFRVSALTDLEVLSSIDQKSEQSIIRITKLYLSLFGESYDDIQLAYDLMNHSVSNTNLAVVPKSELGDILKSASSTLRGFNNYLDRNQNISNALKALFEFDDQGYMTYHGQIYCYKGGYILDTGYLVIPNVQIHGYEEHPLTEEDVSSINMGVQFKEVL